MIRVFVITAILLASSPALSEVFLSDDFETGNFNSPGGTTGFWGAGEATVSSAASHSGTYSIAFPFTGPTIQKDFNIGTPITDMYISYWIYFPADYTTNAYTSGAQNNKLILVQGEDHDDPMTVDVEFEALDLAPYGGFKLPRTGSPYTPICASPPVSPGYVWGGDFNIQQYFGQWVHFEWHFKVDTGSGNGAFEFWVNGVELFSRTNVVYENSPPCSPGYWSEGYLMGAPNTDFDPVTTVYIDDVVISDVRQWAGAAAQSRGTVLLGEPR